MPSIVTRREPAFAARHLRCRGAPGRWRSPAAAGQSLPRPRPVSFAWTAHLAGASHLAGTRSSAWHRPSDRHLLRDAIRSAAVRQTWRRQRLSMASASSLGAPPVTGTRPSRPSKSRASLSGWSAVRAGRRSPCTTCGWRGRARPGRGPPGHPGNARPRSIVLTTDTFTSVLPDVARRAAEAIGTEIPRAARAPPNSHSAPALITDPSRPTASERLLRAVREQGIEVADLFIGRLIRIRS